MLWAACWLVFVWVALVAAAPLTSSNAAWNTNRNPALDPANYYGEWANHTYTPSPSRRYWQSYPFLYIMVDRGWNGDPRNDGSMADSQHIFFRHGGDLVGLRARLPFFASLGVRAIVLGPIMKNDGVDTYHGYKVADMTLLDERFGTLTDLRAFVTGAHERGIYVVLDFVVQHLGYVFAEDWHDSRSGILRDEQVVLPDAAWAAKYPDFSWNNTVTFACATLDPETIRIRNLTRPDVWTSRFCASDFHHWNKEAAMNEMPLHVNYMIGRFFGGEYADLATERAHVREKVLAAMISWVASADVDGFRLDAVGLHTDVSYQQWLISSLRERAGLLGKDAFFLISEM